MRFRGWRKRLLSLTLAGTMVLSNFGMDVTRVNAQGVIEEVASETEWDVEESTQELTSETEVSAEEATTQEATSEAEETTEEVTTQEASSQEVTSEEDTSKEETTQEATTQEGASLEEEGSAPEEAVAFEQKEKIDEIQVQVKADPGVFPADAELKVKKVEDEELVAELDEKIRKTIEKKIEGRKQKGELLLFDVAVCDKDGEEIQPDQTKGKVFISFENLEVDQDEIEEIQITHIDDETEKVELLETKDDIEEGKAEAEVEHFSMYGLALLGSEPDDDGEEHCFAYVNNKLADKSLNLTFDYGEELSFAVKKGSATRDGKIYYLEKNAVRVDNGDIDTSNFKEITGSVTPNVGEYVIFYNVDGDYRMNSIDFQFWIKAMAVKDCDEQKFAWDGKKATWEAPTVDQNGRTLVSPVLAYEVKLYKGDTLVHTYASTDSLQMDCSAEIAEQGFGKYYFTVKAIPENGNYKATKESGKSGEFEYKDTTEPVIESFTVESDEAGYYLKGRATDGETSILAYAFAPSDVAQEDLAWQTATPAGEKTVEVTARPTVEGTYYFYAKDESGNVGKKEIDDVGNAVKISKLVLHDCYSADANASREKEVIFYNDLESFDLDPLVMSRRGYDFGGWFTTSQCDGTAVAGVVKPDVTDEFTIGTKFHLYGKWTKQTVAFATNLPASVTKIYGEDGGITLQATLASVNLDSVDWTWYVKKEDDSEYKAISADQVTVAADSLTSSIQLKNVADTGEYYAVAVVHLEGMEDRQADSAKCSVTINKRVLKLTAATEVTYMDAAPALTFAEDKENESTEQGLVYGQSLASVLNAIDSSEYMSCPYEKGNAVGTYAITKKKGITAKNYEVDLDTLGFVTVEPMDVTKKNVISAVLPDGDHYELSATNDAITPAVTVKRILAEDGDGIALSASTDYDVSYENNVNVSTAENPAKVVLTFKGNYTGTIKVSFTIQKITYAPTVSLDGWKYGETANTPSISELRESATVTYYYKKNDGSNTTAGGSTTKPENAGNYYVWAHVSATTNYDAFDTEITEFSIAKRTIVVTAKSQSWEYDGNTHSNANYDLSGDGFTAADSFRYVSVTGSIKDLGEVDNILTCELSSSTLASNYDITIKHGKLTITKQKLVNPSSFAWSTSTATPGTVSWIALTRDNVKLQYRVKLYRKDGDNYTLIKEDTTNKTNYDFLETIHEDSKDAPHGYTATIQVEPVYVADEKHNYVESKESAYISAKYTAHISTRKGTGVEKITFGEYDGSEDPIVVLQNEPFMVYDHAMHGYTTDTSSHIWSVEQSALEACVDIAHPWSGRTEVKIKNGTLSAPAQITLVANNEDARPWVRSFSAQVSKDNKQASVSFEVEDGIALKKYAVSTKKPIDRNDTSWESYLDWVDITGEPTVYKDTVNITEGAWYLYVMDTAGNVNYNSYGYADNPTSVVVYKISFDKGADDATGTMDAIYKLKNVDVELPALAFRKTAFAFKNWKGKKTGFFTDEGHYTANESDELVAQWTDEQYTYTVEYYEMDLEGKYANEPTKTHQFTCAYDTEITNHTSAIQAIPKGFSLDDAPYDEYENAITVQGNGKILKVYYKRNTHTIRYTYKNVDNSDAEPHEDTYLYGQDVKEWKKPTQTGYTFVGWDWGSAGDKPATMPDEDIVATGAFKANVAEYKIVYYFQNLDTSSLDYEKTKHYLAPSFAEGNMESVKSTHGTVISVSTGDAPEFDGYQIQAVKTSMGAVAGTSTTWDEFNALKDNTEFDTASGTVAEQLENPPAGYENGPLYINYYYTRNEYDLDLNVYKDARETGTNLYTKNWKFPYGYPFAEETAEDATTYKGSYFETFNKEHWTDNWPADKEKLEDYKLADFKDWSTGDRPTAMPAGDVTITREYATATKIKYTIEVYNELITTKEDGSRVAEGDFNHYTTYTRYGNLGSKIEIKKESDIEPDKSKWPDNTTYISFEELAKAIPFYQDYEHNEENDLAKASEVLQGTVTETVVDGVATNHLVLKVHFVHKEYTAFVRYYSSEYPNAGDNKVFAYTTYKQKWGTTYPIEALYYYDSKVPTGEAGSENAVRTVLDGAADEAAKDFRNGCYVVSETSYRRQLDNVNMTWSPNMKCSTADDLKTMTTDPNYKYGIVGRYNGAEDITTYNGKGHQNYVDVYYTFTNRELHYVLNARHEINNTGNYTPITCKIMETPAEGGDPEEHTYKLRIANKADVFKTTSLLDGTNNSYYPAEQLLTKQYEYEKDAQGNEVLRDGFTAVTIENDVSGLMKPRNGNGSGTYGEGTKLSGTYYIKGEYIYTLDPNNTLYYGNRASYTVYGTATNQALVGWKEFVAEDNQPKDGNPIPYYNGYTSINMIGSADPIGNNEAANFNAYYYDVDQDYYITYVYTSSEDIRTYQYKEVVPASRLGEGTHFSKKDGYDIVWYTDQKHTIQAGDQKVDCHITLYGREESHPNENMDYAYYMDLDGNYVSQEDVRNAELWTEVVSEDALTSGKQKITDTVSAPYVNEFGISRSQTGTRVRYYVDGKLVASRYPHFTTSYTEFHMTYNDYLLDGFTYDDANTKNKSKAYCANTPVSMHAYFMRSRLNLTVSENKTVTDNDVVTVRKYQEQIVLPDPEKVGYTFDHWELKKETADGYVALTDEEIGTISYVDGEGTTTFNMPSFSVKATAKYSAAKFDYDILYFFQNKKKVYNTELYTSIQALAGEDITVSYEGTDETAKAYKSGEELLAVSRTIGDITYYYTGMGKVSGEEKYYVEQANLFAAKRVLNNTLKSEEAYSLSIYEMSGLGDVFEFAFLQQQNEGETTTYTDMENDKFTAYATMNLAYYYARSSSSVIRAIGIPTTGSSSGITITGVGSHYYGENINIYGTIASGFTFEGWYKAEDVLVDYPTDGTVPASLDGYTLVDAETRATKEKLNAGDTTAFSVDVKGSADYVAVTIPGSVTLPDEVEISSVRDLTNNPYFYGYEDDEKNQLKATIHWKEDSGANYIKGYEWYVRYYDTTVAEDTIPKEYTLEDSDVPLGKKASTYKIEPGKDAGTYVYCIEVTIARKDNGLESKAYAYYTVKIEQNTSYVSTYPYSGAYDAQAHSYYLYINDRTNYDTNTFKVYYSTEKFEGTEISKADIEAGLADGTISTNKLECTDVLVDGDEKVIPHKGYYYVESLDHNYADVAGVEEIKIEPIYLTVEAGSKPFTKIYDAGTKVKGTLEETDKESDFYRLAMGSGDYYVISGILESEKSLPLYLDFEAHYDSKHVKSATSLELTKLWISQKDVNKVTRNYNYRFDDGKTLHLSGQIKPYPLAVEWLPTVDSASGVDYEDAAFTYNYSGTPQGPYVKITDDNPPDGLDDFSVLVTNKQINAGTYTAGAEIETKAGAAYESTDYTFSLTSKAYQIVSRYIKVQPKTITKVYNGSNQTQTGADEFEFLTKEKESDAWVAMPSLPTGETFTVETDQAYKNAGVYAGISARKLNIFNDVGKNIMDNYITTYGTGTLTIAPAPVIVESGITASDKDYDGKTDATLDVSNAVFKVEKTEGNTSDLIDLYGSDQLALDADLVSGAFEDASAGTNKDVTITYNNTSANANGSGGVLTGTAANNYKLIVADSMSKTKASISGATQLQISVHNAELVYGDAALASDYGYDISGFVNQDNKDNIGLTGEITYVIYKKVDGKYEKVRESGTAETMKTLPAGTYYIAPSVDANNVIQGLTASNYTIKWNGSYGTLNVKKRKIQVQTATDRNITKTYDGTDAATVTNADYTFVAVSGNTSSGVVNADTVDLKSYQKAYNSANATVENDERTAQKVQITKAVLTDAAAANYELVNTSFDIKGTITAIALTITAENKTITYGDAVPTFTYKVEGAIEEEQTAIKTAVAAGMLATTTYNPVKGDANRVVGTYPITIDQTASYQNTNYSITYVNGTITVGKKTVHYVANDASMIYGKQTLPTFTGGFKAADWVYDESESVLGSTYDVSNIKCYESGSTPVSNQTPYGTYAIVPEKVDELSADNYTFEATNGTLSVVKYYISVDNVYVLGKIYDGTTTVTADHIVTDQVRFIYYEDGNQYTVTCNDSDAEKKAKAEEFLKCITITAEYETASAGKPKKVNVHISLNDKSYLDQRYVLLTEETKAEAQELDEHIDVATLTQTETNAVIMKDDGSYEEAGIDARALELYPTDQTIKYGESIQVTTDETAAANQSVVKDTRPTGSEEIGFVDGEGLTTIGFVLKATINDVDVSGTQNRYSQVTDVGTYTMDISTSTPTAGEHGNYNISYKNGTLTIEQNTFPAPKNVKWSTDSASVGTIFWDAVAQIGNVAVDHYEVELYKGDTKINTYDTTSTSMDMSTYIRANKSGVYKVKVRAIASITSNDEYKNVKKEGTWGTSGVTYASEVTVAYATDADTAAASSTKAEKQITNAEPTTSQYVVITGETAIPIQYIWSCTRSEQEYTSGYAIKSITSSNDQITIAAGTDDSVNGTYRSTISAASLATGEDITITLTLEPRQADLTVVVKEKSDTTQLPYGYAENAATFKVTTSHATSAEYTYTYKWYYQLGTNDGSRVVAEETSDTFALPRGLRVNKTEYRVFCEVIATRKDNGKSQKKKAYAPITIVKRQPSAADAVSYTLTDWVYGNARGTIEANKLIEGLGDITLEYNTTNDGTDSNWTTTIPKNVGTYYVRANIAASENVNAIVCNPSDAFHITQNTLGTPTNLAVGVSAGNAAYGYATWDAVAGPKENAGTVGDSDSSIGVSYQVKLYAVDESGTKTLIKEYPVTTDTNQDMSSDLNSRGKYCYSVTAISDNQTNCANGAETFYSAIINVSGVLKSNLPNNSFTKEYDGEPIVLSVDFGESATGYQWFKNGVSISGATSATYNVTTVAESAIYSCQIKVGDNVYESTFNQVTITPRPLNKDAAYNTGISVEDIASHVYDAQAYTPGVTVKDAGLKNTDGSPATEATLVLTTDYTVSYANNVAAGTATVTITGTGNYKGSITKNYQITGLPITITAGNATKEYDGTPLTFEGVDGYQITGAYSISSGALLTGDSIDGLTLTGSQTTTGTSSNVASAVRIKNAGGTDVTASYDVSYVAGTLTVTQSTQQVTFTGASFEYDGNPHTIVATVAPKTGITNGTTCGAVTYYQVVNGEETLLGNSYSFTDAGTYVIRAKVAETNDYAAITSEDITLSITKRPIKITANSNAKTYDGQALTDAGYTVEYAGTKQDVTQALGKEDTINVTVTGSVVDANVGTTENNGVTAYSIQNKGGTDITSKNYTVTTEKGTLTVNPRPVSLSWSHDNLGSWTDAFATVYNNQDRTVSASITNIVSIEGVVDDVAVATYENNVKKAKGDYTAKALTLTGTRASNYTLTGGSGLSRTWSITSKERTITVSAVDDIYTGTPYEVSPSADGAEDAATLTVVYTPKSGSPALVNGKPVHAGVYDVKVTAAATANYAAAEETTTVTIQKRAITLTSDSNTWTYDGTAHKQESLSTTIGGNGLATNESITSVNYTGTITDVAYEGQTVTTVPNTYNQVVITNSDVSVGTTTADYTITSHYGTLKVTPHSLDKLVLNNQESNPVNIAFTGSEVGPSYKVTADGICGITKQLTETTDFVVTVRTADKKQKTAIYPDTYIIEVSGVGNYEGTLSKMYKIVDSGKPELTGIENGKNYCKEIPTVTIKDPTLASVEITATIDGVESPYKSQSFDPATETKDSGNVVKTYELPGSETGTTYKIVAKDMSNNENETMIVTVYSDHVFTTYVPAADHKSQTANCDHSCGTTDTRAIEHITVNWNYAYSYSTTSGTQSGVQGVDARATYAKITLKQNHVAIATRYVNCADTCGVNKDATTGSQSITIERYNPSNPLATEEECQTLLPMYDSHGNAYSYYAEVTAVKYDNGTYSDAQDYTTQLSTGATQVPGGYQGFIADISYGPNLFDVPWKVVLTGLPTANGESVVPEALYVKVLFAYGPNADDSESASGYEIISQQSHNSGTYCDVYEVDGHYECTGKYAVWQYQAGTTKSYYHRIQVVGYRYNGEDFDVSGQKLKSINDQDHENHTIYYIGNHQASGTILYELNNMKMINPVVLLDHNKGTDETNVITGSPNHYVVTPGGDVTTEQLTAAEPSRNAEYYDFDGWYDAAVGGTKVTELHDVTEDTTLYAHWKEKVKPNGRIDAESFSWSDKTPI
ncbi:MAG: MBG domain-containing protein [Eubacteriales bacterium]|nr:MBG domain-containing protein [Eubacteriales bacterium]